MAEPTTAFSSFDSSSGADRSELAEPTKAFSSFGFVPQTDMTRAGTGLSGIPEAPASWSDVYHAGVAGLHEVGGALAGAIASQEGAMPGWQQTAVEQQRAAEAEREQIMPTVREAGIRRPMVWAAEQAPGMAAGVGASLIGGAVAGPVGAAAGAGMFFGSQMLGEVQNRAAEQGIELTPAQKAEAFGVGAAAGVIPEGGGKIAEKLVAGPLARRVLLGGAETLTFGGAQAGQEALSEQPEIAAGKRAGYDPWAIAQSGLSGAEFGAGMAAVHLPGALWKSRRPGEPAATTEGEQPGAKQVDRHQEQTGGVATVTRGGKGDSRKEEAQGATGGKVPGEPSPGVKVTGPTNVDADTSAAIKGEPIGKPVGEQVAERAPVTPEVTPPAAADAKARVEAPPATAPPTAPETPPAPMVDPRVAEQHAELTDPNHPREMMAYPPGHDPLPLPGDRFGQTKLKDERIVQYDKQGDNNLSYQKLHSLARYGTMLGNLDDILEAGTLPKPEAKPAPERAVAGEAPAPAERPAAPADAGVVAPEAAPEAPAPAMHAPTLEEQLKARQAERVAQEQATKTQFEAERAANTERLKREMNERLRQGAPDRTGVGVPGVAEEGLAREGLASSRLSPEERAAVEEQRRRREAREAQGTPKGTPTGRVVEARGEEEARAQAAQAGAQKAATTPTKPLTRVTKEKEEQKPGRDKERREANIESNRVAKEVVGSEAHKPQDIEAHAIDPTKEGGKGARNALKDRLKAMVKEAADKGFQFVKSIKDRKDPEEAHNPESVLLHEAKRLLDLKVPKTSDFERYLAREEQLLKGDVKGALETRRAEGRESAAERGVAKETAVEEVAPVSETPGAEEELAAETVDEARARERNEELERQRQQMADALERKRAAAEETQRAREHEEEKEQQREIAERLAKSKREEGEGEGAKREPAAVTGFQRVEVKRRTITRKLGSREEGEREGEPTGIGHHVLGKEILTDDYDNNPISVTSHQTALARDLMTRGDLKNYLKTAAEELRPMVEALYNRVNEIGGGVKVEFINDADMRKAMGERGDTYGYYHPDEDRIYLNKDLLDKRPDTLFHEVFHAATFKAIDKQPELKALILRVRKEAMYNLPLPDALRGGGEFSDDEIAQLKYAFANADEFLTGVMTNPVVQRFLRGVKISDELARDIGIPKWRKATGFNGIIHTILNAFGLTPRHASVIEAALSLSEAATFKRDPGAGMAYAARWDKLPSRELSRKLASRLDPEAMRDDEEKAGGRFKTISDRLPQVVRDAPTNLKAKFRERLPDFLNGVQKAKQYGHLFTNKDGENIIQKLNHLDGMRHYDKNKLDEGDRELVNRGQMLAKKHQSDMPKFGELISQSSRFNIHADRAAPSVKDPVKGAKSSWQTVAKWDKASKLYKALPNELQQHYRDLKAFYADKGKEIGSQHIDTVLDTLPLPSGVTRAEMRQRIMDGKMTDEDMEHYHDRGALGGVQMAQRLMTGRDAYFPAFRDGDHIVTARHVMPEGGDEKGMDGKALADNTREFASAEDAHKYATATDLNATVRTAYYAKDTGERLIGDLAREKAEDALRGGKGNVAERSRVTLQREHMEMHRSPAEAERGRQEIIDNGLQDVSGVLDRRNEKDWGQINSADAAAIESRINKRDDLNSAQKSAAVDAARQTVLMMRTALQGHLLKRRNVAGADYGHVDAARSYSNAANTYIVGKRYTPKLDAAMKELDEADKGNRADPEKSYVSSAVANSIREQMYARPSEMSSRMAPFMNRLMSLSYMRWMLGPRHLLMMQSHPYAYSSPHMAGRHGSEAYTGMHRAAKDLGGDFLGMGKGVKASVDQIRSMFEGDPEKALALARTLNMTDDMISRLKSEDERAALRTLASTGHLHSGFGDDVYGATGMAKVDAVYRQLTSAQDAQNRAVVGLNAYRLELKKTGSEAKALAYARGVIEDTIGVNTPGTMAPALTHPLARAFMQFKHFPLRQVELMARNIYGAFKGESKEVKTEALRAFAHQFASGFTMAGVHGLPVGLLKVVGMLGYGLNITPAPSQIDDKVRQGLAGLLGPTGANMIMDGVLAAVPHAPNLSNMFSYDLDAMFGEPKYTRQGTPDWGSYLINTLGGAPAGFLSDSAKGLAAVGRGDWNTVLNTVPAPRLLTDAVKAYKLSQEGLVTAKGEQLTPASYEDAGWRLLGFGTQQAARVQEGRALAQQAIQAQQQARGAKGQALKAKAKQSVLGIPVTKSNRALLQQYGEVYQ